MAAFLYLTLAFELPVDADNFPSGINQISYYTVIDFQKAVKSEVA